MENLSPLQKWYEAHKDKITWGTILYLLATVQASQTAKKESDERANHWENKYVERIEADNLAKSRALFKRLVDSDTPFILGPDAAKDSTLSPSDTGKEDTAP